MKEIGNMLQKVGAKRDFLVSDLGDQVIPFNKM
jgi:hypothetical protein